MFTIVKQKEQKKKSVSFPIQLFQTHNTFFCALQPPRKPPGSLDKFTTDNYGWQCCFLNLLPFLFCDSLIAPNSLCREERQSYSHYFKNTLIKKQFIHIDCFVVWRNISGSASCPEPLQHHMNTLPCCQIDNILDFYRTQWQMLH